MLARASDRNLATTLNTLATAALAFGTKINPLWALGGAALLGLCGLV